MNAATQPHALHEHFLALLPRIQLHAEIYFRNIKCPNQRADAIQESVATAWKCFVRLTEQGKDVNEFPMTFIALVAKGVKHRRRLVGMAKAKDVMNPLAQQKHGFIVELWPASIRATHEELYGTIRGQLKQDAFEERLRDNTQTPIPDQVAFRLDFPVWRKTRSERDRRVVDDLMVGERTQDVAAKLLRRARVQGDRMNADLFANPQLLSLLEAGRQTPEDDVPRLVLADWLEEHGEVVRAEFIRLQCQLAPGALPLETRQRKELEARESFLLSRNGGGWLGPLWQYWLSPLSWHRGLLAVQMPRGHDIPAFGDVIPWIDTALFRVNGPRSLHRVVTLLTRMGVNHVYLDLRVAMRTQSLLQELACVPESPELRSLTFEWPFRLHGQDQEGFCCLPAVMDEFVGRLVAECPLSRHLTYLGSSWPFTEERVGLLRRRGIEPIHAEQQLWMHDLSPSCFQHRTAPAQHSRP